MSLPVHGNRTRDEMTSNELANFDSVLVRPLPRARTSGYL